MRRRIQLLVNGRDRSVEIEAHHTLLEVLRDDLGLTGTKECCLVGECGACTVLLDGRSVDSCLVLAIEADGAAVTTVEGLASPDGALDPLQQAFLDMGRRSAGSASRASWSRRGRCSPARRGPAAPRSRRAWPATCAGAPATSRSSRRSLDAARGREP